jgi:hypothetical protein
VRPTKKLLTSTERGARIAAGLARRKAERLEAAVGFTGRANRVRAAAAADGSDPSAAAAAGNQLQRRKSDHGVELALYTDDRVYIAKVRLAPGYRIVKDVI